MQVNRTFNIEAVDAILRDPSVFGGIIDDSSPIKANFTSSDLLSDHRNIALMVSEQGEDIGCFICIQCSPTTYEGHINLTALCRGRKALEALDCGAQWLFLNTDAFRIVGLTPESNKPALSITRLAGYKKIATRENAVKISGVIQGVIQSELTLYSWLSQQPIYSKIDTQLDNWHLQNLLFAHQLIQSGKSDKAKFLLVELSNQSYSRIRIDLYPIIEIEGQKHHINELF